MDQTLIGSFIASSDEDELKQIIANISLSKVHARSTAIMMSNC